MDIQHLLYFEKHEATKAYLTMINNNGQVYYCETNEDQQPDGNWKLINLDFQAMSQLH